MLKSYFASITGYFIKGKDPDPYPLHNGSGSWRPKNMRIRVRSLSPNTATYRMVQSSVPPDPHCSSLSCKARSKTDPHQSENPFGIRFKVKILLFYILSLDLNLFQFRFLNHCSNISREGSRTGLNGSGSAHLEIDRIQTTV